MRVNARGREPTEPVVRSRTILVVSREEDTRAMLKLLLDSFVDGARVETTASVPEALGLLERTPVDLILTDHDARGNDDHRLLETARAVAPRVAFIRIAPDTESAATPPAHEPKSANERILLPLTDPGSLVQAVRRALVPAEP